MLLIERFRFYWRHSLNDLRVNSQRSLFGILCIASGVTAVVGLLSLGVIIENSLTESLQETNRGDIALFPEVNEDVPFNEVEGAHNRDQVLTEIGGSITLQGIDKIRTWLASNYPADFEDVDQDITFRAQLSEYQGFINNPSKSTSSIALSFVIEADKYPLYGDVESENDKPLAEMLNDPTDIVISRNLADSLNAEVGDVLELSGSTTAFTVRGIVPTDSEAGLENVGAALLGYFYIDIESTPHFAAAEDGPIPNVEDVDLNIDRLYLRLDNPARVEEIDRALTDRYPYLGTRSTEDLKRLNQDIASGTTQFISVIGLVSLLIGGIGIVNTMLVIVRRRTTEVAVLKTLGLEPHEITTLFLIEAIMMGLVGSLLGIVAGWLLGFLMQNFAETLFNQEFTYTITPGPALTGLVIGMVVTAIFGLMPTLAAGQVRPAAVLRPSDTIIPKTGRAAGFAALLVVIVALSVLAQGLIGDLVDINALTTPSGIAGAVVGFLMGLALAFSGLFRHAAKHNFFIVLIRWGGFVILPPALGFFFGENVQALLFLLGTILIVSYLFVMLWLLIWAVGGGKIGELIPGVFVLAIPIFWPLIPILIILLIPSWILGWIIQRYSFVDFKIAMRAMLAAKSRGASTLVALVVGVFALSLLTMMVTAFKNIIEELQIDAVGGNVIILAGGERLGPIEQTIVEQEGVRSYAIVAGYETEFISMYDKSAEQTLSFADLRNRLNVDEEENHWKPDFLREVLSNMNGRSVQSNLPDVQMVDGRQLDAEDTLTLCPKGTSKSDPTQNCTTAPPLVVRNSPVIEDIGLEAGDRLAFRLASQDGTETVVDFEVVGILDSAVETFGSNLYTSLDTFRVEPDSNEFTFPPNDISIIVDMDEGKIPELRRNLSKIGFVFVLETRLINDLLNRIIDYFTQFPIVVTALALITSGIVIANSVALSTMERRREIAIMKAVGMSRRRVLGLLVLENVLMGIIGGLIGVGIGVIILILMQEFVFEGQFGSIVPYDRALLLMLLCVGISVLAALLSVWGASSEKPLNVLRYE